MINNVVLTGRLTRDPELKHTTNGTAVANLTLAVNRTFKTQDGQDADFIDCVAFRKTAETMANHLNKGSLIGVEGRIQTRNYENKQGQKVYVTEVVVNNFTFLESKNQTNSKGQGASQNKTNINNNNDPFVQNGDPIDISDEDLPF